MAGRLEQIAERRAVRGAAPVAHVHGTGGVRGHELDHHLAAGAHLAVAVGRALRGDGLEAREPGSPRQPEIDEPGAGDLRAGDEFALRQRGDDGLGQFARILARGLGQPHGDVAGEVAMFFIARAFDHDLRGIDRVAQNGGNK